MSQLALLELPDAVLERIALLAARRTLRDGQEGAGGLPVELLPAAGACRRLRAAVGAACVELRFTPPPAGAVRKPPDAGKGIELEHTLRHIEAWIRLAGPALRRIAFVEMISYDSCAERLFRVVQNCGAPVQELNLTGMPMSYASDMAPIRRLLASLRMSLRVLKIWLKNFHTAALPVANALAAAKLVKLHTFGVHNLPENAIEANPFALFVLLDSVSACKCRPDGARLRTLLLTFRDKCQVPGFAPSGRGHACSYPGLSELIIDSCFGHDVLPLLDGLFSVMPDLRRLSMGGVWLHKESVDKVCCKNLDELRLSGSCAVTPVSPFDVFYYIELEKNRKAWNPPEFTKIVTESGGKLTSLCLTPDMWLRLRIEDLLMITDSCPRLKCLNIRLGDGAIDGLRNMCFALRDTLESLTVCNGERDGSTIVDQLHGLTVADAIKQTRCLRDLALFEFPFSPSVLADMIKYAGPQLRTCSIRAWNGFVPMHMRHDASIVAGGILDSISENNRGLHKLAFTSPVDFDLKVSPWSPQGARLVTTAMKLLRVSPCLDTRDVTDLMGHYLTEVPPVTY